MLAKAKKIASSDITFAIPRRNWTTGTTYDIYRHDYGDTQQAQQQQLLSQQIVVRQLYMTQLFMY